MPLNIPSIGKFSDEELISLCLANPDLNIERDEKGQILINMSPTYALTSSFNSLILIELGLWNRKKKTGTIFESNSAFFLPDSSMKGPDVAWISKGRWQNLSLKEKKSIPKLVPDFIIELQSETDNQAELKQKMEKWMENGVKLAWLVSPQSQETMVYFENTIESVPFKNKLDGKNVLVDLEIIMSEILEE
ncbi:Uma2 family endonuclease [Lacihabitans sp. LS3-19]|uniref:Uma2 family endonuclease n=1 Tax=Lacihabitans sp. LS3-19 TaxID=2487335 RepID=UPI0020CC2005|nr:Uma2 family endonuclease [Lacihabitans sp. LS3-19]